MNLPAEVQENFRPVREPAAAPATSKHVCIAAPPAPSGSLAGPGDTLAPIRSRPGIADDDSASGDDVLVERARGGDPDALEAPAAPALRPHLRRVSPAGPCNDADAADAAQNATIAVAQGLALFDVRSRFSTWTYRIAVNCSIDEMHRRRSRWPLASLEEVKPSRASQRDDTEVVHVRAWASTPHCGSCRPSSGPRWCSGICAASTTPRSPTFSTCHPGPCGSPADRPGAQQSGPSAGAGRGANRDLQGRTLTRTACPP